MIDHLLAGQLHVLGISGSRSSSSSSKIAVTAALDFAAGAHCDVYTELIGLDECWLEPCHGRDTFLYGDATVDVIDRVVSADALIVGSPIYRGSSPGVLKNLFDLIPGDALEGKVVGLIATGGTPHHFLAIEQELKPLMGYFRAVVVPCAVFAHEADFVDECLADENIIERLRQFADAVVDTARRLAPGSPRLAARGSAVG